MLCSGEMVLLYGVSIDRCELLWALVNLRRLGPEEFAKIYGRRAGWYFGKNPTSETQDAIVARVLNDQARLSVIRHGGATVEFG